MKTINLHRYFFWLTIVSALFTTVFFQNISAQVFSESARTEFFGGMGLRIFYGQINKTQLLTDGENVDNADAPDVYVSAVPLALVYGVKPRLSLIGVFPTIRRRIERTIDGQRLSDTDTGLGDITLFVKYRFYKKTAFLKRRQLSFQAGIKLPTGKDNLIDSRGNLLPPPLQLGSGSVDYRFFLTFTDVHNRFQLLGDAGYTLRTEANNFKFGDRFNYDATAKFRLYPFSYGKNFPTHDLFVFVELNGIVTQKAKTGGRTIDNSGGHQIFLAPGFQFFLLENFILEAGVQVPVVQELNGTQLATAFNFRIGFRWIFVP